MSIAGQRKTQDSHYPDHARYVARACAKNGWRFTDLDNGGGYLFRVSDALRSFISGAGAVCAYPLNSAPACGIAADKYHTAAVLAERGLPAVQGRLFFITAHHAALRGPGRERADALRFFSAAEKPVFCKPNNGSRGSFAEPVSDEADFRSYIARLAGRHDAMLVQPFLTGTEYRVFCIDGKAVFALEKEHARLTGTGTDSVIQLIRAYNERLRGHGISPLDEAGVLKHWGIGGDHRLKKGESLPLPGRRNISTGGGIAAFYRDVPAPLAALARKGAAAIGLRVAGVDIFDLSGKDDLSQLSIIEVNGNPAITALEKLGHDALIDEIWATIIATYFREHA